jgi:hypothetical protein
MARLIDSISGTFDFFIFQNNDWFSIFLIMIYETRVRLSLKANINSKTLCFFEDNHFQLFIRIWYQSYGIK